MKLFKKDSSFYGKVFTIAIPIALQSLITIGVNMLDNIMLGKLENADAPMSAASLANSFIGIYHIFCMGLGMGASVLVSRYWGMKQDKTLKNVDPDKALKQTIAIMLRITLLLATLFAVATYFIPDVIMKMYIQDPAGVNGVYTAEELAKISLNKEILKQGVEYLKYSVITFFFVGTSLTSTIVLRSVGQVKLPLFVSIGAFFVNLGANYVLIFGKFGAPRMEVAGAALGTLIARIFEAVCIVGYLLFIDKKISFRFKHLFMKTKSLLSEYFRICIPVLISDGILALGNNAVAMVIGRLGGQFVTANSITMTTQQLSTVVVQGVSQGGAIVTGQTLGAGDKEKTMEQGYLFLGLGIGLGILSAIFIMVTSNPIISFFSEASAEAKAIAAKLMVAISIIMVFQATNSIMTKGVLRGGGDTKVLMIADNIMLWVISIPLGILAGFVFKLSPFWIYICLKSDQILKAFWCVLRLRSGKWIKKITTGK